VQSVPITTKDVSSKPVNSEVYTIQHYGYEAPYLGAQGDRPTRQSGIYAQEILEFKIAPHKQKSTVKLCFGRKMDPWTTGPYHKTCLCLAKEIKNTKKIQKIHYNKFLILIILGTVSAGFNIVLSLHKYRDPLSRGPSSCRNIILRWIFAFLWRDTNTFCGHAM
jgi:hypothetical protein